MRLLRDSAEVETQGVRKDWAKGQGRELNQGNVTLSTEASWVPHETHFWKDILLILFSFLDWRKFAQSKNSFSFVWKDSDVPQWFPKSGRVTKQR